MLGQYPSVVLGKVRYGRNTGIEHSGKVRYELDTGTRHFGMFGTTLIPVPDISVSSVRPPKKNGYGHTLPNTPLQERIRTHPHRVALRRGVDAHDILDGEDDDGCKLHPVEDGGAVGLVRTHRRHGHHYNLAAAQTGERKGQVRH